MFVAQDKSDSILFNTQYVKDISFENIKVPNSLYNETKSKINVSININANSILDRKHEVILEIKVTSIKNSDFEYIIDLKYAGIFTIKKTVNANEKEKLICIQCPSLLFPYARRIISDLSRDGGYLPLYILPIDFFALYNKKLG